MSGSVHIGRHETQRDTADPHRIGRLAALLDHDEPPWAPGMLPPLGHWLCFQPDARQSLIGPDGHPLRTGQGLLPEIDLPRRMWAGSRIHFFGDIPLETSIVRHSTVIAATPKTGRSGNMLFVTVRHQIYLDGGEIAVIEDQDIVYREASRAGASTERSAEKAGDADPVTRIVTPDPVMLFRYSALTFNAHRIHYDRDFCRDTEGYQGLVVQGPLLATLLLDLLLRNRNVERLTSYAFRATAPIFEGEPVTLGLKMQNDGVRLRAVGPAGPAMTAVAGFSV